VSLEKTGYDGFLVGESLLKGGTRVIISRDCWEK